MSDRRQKSYEIRVKAAEQARSRPHPEQKANGDEQQYGGGEKYFMSFTKGLPHNPDTGLLQEPQDFVELRRAIDEGFIDPFSDRVRHGAKFKVVADLSSEDGYKIEDLTNCQLGDNSTSRECQSVEEFRQWEAPTAGVAFELEGADPQEVTMAPAPPLLGTDGEVNPELALEMAEVYELAILRDVEFNNFENNASDTTKILSSIDRLNDLPYIAEEQTGRPRKVNDQGELDLQRVFRGSSPGVEVGPYLSQFLLIGTTDRNGKGSVAQGKISYGVLQIDQRVPIALPCEDFMTNMNDYVAVQRGLKREQEIYQEDAQGLPLRRFISTPRDLATYVHYDALYEAYLNAAIILLEMGTPFDPGFDHLSGGGAAAGKIATRRNAGGFALYGGPHILTLVTEVATRALKAVRYQKFNNHLRLRPEALAARIELLRDPSQQVKDNTPPALANDIGKLKSSLQDTLSAIASISEGTYFLPMAFPEGSPMHPSYGAGHATVAGACVTILKAFFDTSAVLAETAGKTAFKSFAKGDQAIAFRSPAIPKNLDIAPATCLETIPSSDLNGFLTLEGELNKLAANISIGRNMAGVHYFTDYYDSLRMGEEIAISILQEQALTYSTDPFILSIPTFDGDVVSIGRR